MHLKFALIKARLKKNFWLIEIGIFSILYGITAIVHNDQLIVADGFKDFSLTEIESWLERHAATLFIISGLVSICLSLCRKTFKTYMVAYSFMAFAVFVRIFSILDGDIPPTDEALFVVWLQVLLLQGKILATNHFSRKERIIQRTPNYTTENLSAHYSDASRGIDE